MIERKFISQNKKEFQIKEYIRNSLNKVGLSKVKLVRTPLGEKIVISASRPGLVVGRSGANISKLTRDIKAKFNLENPQIELDEVSDPSLDANIIAEMIASSLERFGSARFKGIGHKALTDVMGAGALGVEIIISGKIPSSRAKNWRFYKGYLKKCGEIAITDVKKATVQAKLKTGIIGIKVNIMPPDVVLPDRVTLLPEAIEVVEEIIDEAVAKADNTAVEEGVYTKETPQKKTKTKTETKKPESNAANAKTKRKKATPKKTTKKS